MPSGGGTCPTPTPQSRRPGKEATVADTQTFTITVEASGEVTPAPPSDDNNEPEETEE